MRFNYRIVGRGDGSLDQTEYAGTVTAENPKMALVAALADQFGDDDQPTPVHALTTGGWTSTEDFLSQFKGIGNDDTFCEFHNDDTTFVIEVEELVPGVDPALERQFTVSVNITTGDGQDDDNDFLVDACVDFTIPGGITQQELTRLVKVLAGGIRDNVLADVWPKRVTLAQVCT